MSQPPEEPLSSPPEESTETTDSASKTLFTGPFLRILVIQFAFGISFSAFLLLPKYLRLELHAGPDEIGALTGAALLWAAVSSPFVGSAAARVSRKTLLSVSLMLEGGAAVLFTLVDELGPFIYFLRAAQGIAFVVVFNCTSTFAADVAPRGQLAQAVGYLGVSMMLTNALAPLLTEPLAARLGWDVAFGISGSLALCALVLVRGLPRDSKVSPLLPTKRRSTRSLLSVYYASFLMGAGLGVMFTFVQPYAIQQGATNVGSFFLGYVPCALFVRVVLGSWADRFGYLKVSVSALVLYAVVLGASSGLRPETLPLFGAGLGICHGFLYPALSAMGLVRLPSSMRAVFMGWFAFAFNAGFAVAVLALGEVAQRMGYGPIFVITAAALSTGVVPLLLARKGHQKSAAFDTQVAETG